MRVAGLVVAGRSLTWPSPSSMRRHVRPARRARSAVTNGSPSELMSGPNGVRSRSGGGWSPGVSGCGVMSRQVPPVHQVRTSAEDEPLHWEPGLLRRIKWSVPVPALWATQSETGEKGDNDNERESRNARSEAQSRAGGRYNRSHRPRPWRFSSPSVARSASVRGPRGPRTR
jgi:hypothetical protein